LQYGKVYRNWSRSSARKKWEGQKILWFGAAQGKKDEEQRPFDAQGKKDEEQRPFDSQTATSKPTPEQERRRMRNEAKGSQYAEKRGGDRATSNAQ